MKRVSVCVCTYRRPDLLRRLLNALELQNTGGVLSFSVVVADNDSLLSARECVMEFEARATFRIEYCVEPRRNIALARNRAVQHAVGDFVALIDDDEIPEVDWLTALVTAVGRYKVAGVLGPVRPHFDQTPPRWLVAGRFCERPEHPTGTVMHWSKSFAGNALLRRELVTGLPSPFREEFAFCGEDVDFFRRMASDGHVFVWCSEAAVKEVVPPGRWTRRYRLQRAMLHGRSSLRMVDPSALVKSALAIPTYALFLPISFLLGSHVLMRCAEKLSGHLGRLLALAGVNLIKERPL